MFIEGANGIGSLRTQADFVRDERTPFAAHAAQSSIASIVMESHVDQSPQPLGDARARTWIAPHEADGGEGSARPVFQPGFALDRAVIAADQLADKTGVG